MLSREEKLARKIKRCLESVPDDLIVIIRTGSIDVCGKDVFNSHIDKYGSIDNIPTEASELIFNKNVKGNDESL